MTPFLLDITAPILVPTWVAWVTAVSASLPAIGLAVFVWVIQGRLADEVKKVIMEHVNTLRQQGEERHLRLEQKIDLTTGQLKENMQSIGADLRTLRSDIATKSDIAIKIDSSASGVKSELSDVQTQLRSMLVTMTTVQTTMQLGFQNLEKTIVLFVKAEVTRQIARGASSSD